MTRQVSFRAEDKTVDALDELAASMDRDRSWVINQAFDAYLDVWRWQAEHIAAAKAEADAGGPFIAHDAVKDWAKTLSTQQKASRKRAAGTTSKSRRR